MLGSAIARELVTDIPASLPDAGDRESVRSRLAEAGRNFAKGAALAGPDYRELRARCLVQFAKCLTARISGCGDRALFDVAVSAWRAAIDAATSEDDGERYRLNLASMLMNGAADGRLDFVDELDRLLAHLQGSPAIAAEEQCRLVLSAIAKARRHLGDARLQLARTRVDDLVDLRNEQGDPGAALKLALNAKERRRILHDTSLNAPGYSLARLDTLLGNVDLAGRRPVSA